jgi:membrane protease YdiL (CAAX protease family)
MVGPLDFVYLALFALALPLWDHFVHWPAFRRRSGADHARERTRLWTAAIRSLWILVALGAALWIHHGRSWAALGFGAPTGWRLGVSLGLVLLLAAYTAYAAAAVARDADARASVRRQSASTAELMPHTRAEMRRFAVLSLSAGFCEEFLYRGYFIWALAPWLGWWGAAALSLVLFASAHAYQGLEGALRVAVVGLVYTLVVAFTGSLWPAIALHALVDLNGGLLAWLALREEAESARSGAALE